jgi:hypothetical protein
VLASGLLFVVLILLVVNVMVQKARARRDSRIAEHDALPVPAYASS